MMMMKMSRSSSNNQNPHVFTAAQWEELEQQALIFKYLASGVPVPTHLILSVRTSLYNNSSSSSSLSNHPNTTSGGVWDGGFPYNHLYQIGGYGRKIDLEPGRCRRTDGKKWRCSKEAYPDSKYCERHMHRGRNRSRKPVEFSSSSATTTTLLNTPAPAASSTTTISKSISHSDAYPPFSSIQTTFMDNSSNYSHQTLKDYRHLQGMKDLGEDERSACFQLNDHHHNYSHFNFQNLKGHQKKDEGQHCFVMGTDIVTKSSSSSIQLDTKVDETSSSSKQAFHHFFSPPKTTLLNPNHDPSKAPLSTQDLFQSKPRPYW